ncbi:MAG: site-specific DNA-methyltransferase [Kiritimatiellae bacterium]|nr:site-specific DNA-methyltransferase [Kiritimatiellia bacterium]
MAAFKDLLKRVTDATLRGQLEDEYKRAIKNKKFGLVFEEHRPEFTALYGVELKVGMSAAVNGLKNADVLQVVSIDDGIATCHNAAQDTMESHPIADLVAVAKFEDPIFPVLTPVDEIENAPGDPLWHTLIQADNYHALQLLEYMYRGKVDCIYIDPPYNTGARDWKYNNDYVDGNDSWRHSKWLSMMEKRLRLAKTLLNPKDSVLIVTIDEKEYLHLGMLLEEMFPEARIQMVSSVINPAGAGKPGSFYRTDEYLYYVQFGASVILPEGRGMTDVPVIWDTLRRSNAKNTREHTNSQFYPIYVNDNTRQIDYIGLPYPKGKAIAEVEPRDGCSPVFPIRDDGTEMMWGCKADELKQRLNLGYVRVGKHTPDKPQKYVISYLTSGIIADIASGKAIVEQRLPDGSVSAYYPTGRDKMPTTNWNRPSHDAQRLGSEFVKGFIGNRFSYPKSIYAEYDCLRIVLANKPDALIVDFFAGSGTTLHAVNLLNAEDGGSRRCIMVTNNEVSESEAKSLTKLGHKPGDEEWEELGIARYVTWPRTVCSIVGSDVNGNPLDGNYGVEVDDYVVDDEDSVMSKKTGKPTKNVIYKKTKRQLYPNLAKMSMSDGFKVNAKFFKLDFVDKDSVRLGRQFNGILPILWMRSGAKGKCPVWSKASEPEMLVKPENGFAVLVAYDKYVEFIKVVNSDPKIKDVYFVTDSESDYHEMCTEVKRGKRSTHLYHSYLENFVIGCRRNSK